MMAQILPRQIISNHRHIVLKDWHIILLNSQKPGAVEGYLEESELNYLQHCLQAYPEHRAIIVFHHHPVKVGSKWLDNLGLTNADTFWNIISHYQRVHTVLYGHVHQVKEELVGDIHCLSAPACCFQFKCQDEFALDHLPPGYRWVEFYPDGRIKTGIKRTANYVGTFDGQAKGY
jgi:Icc protein